MKKYFWLLHSITGLVAGLGLTVIGVSGALLVFHQEIDALCRPEQVRVEPLPSGRLPLNDLIATVEAAFPGHAVTGWQPSEPGSRQADGVFVMPFGTRHWQYLTLDPYRGKILSQPELHGRTLKGWLLELHTELFLHHTGVALAGLLGLAMCFLGISGIYLCRRCWRNLFRLRWKASLRLLCSDVHRLTGVLSAGLHLLLGFTGAFWSLSHTLEDWKGGHADPGDEILFHHKLFPAGLDVASLPQQAQTHLPGFQTRYISFPWAPGGPFTLWGSQTDAGWFRSRFGSQVTFDSRTGAFVSLHDLRQDGTWAQILDSFEPLHFGDFGGLPVKILWATAGCTPALLSVSGMIIWWKRQRKRTR